MTDAPWGPVQQEMIDALAHDPVDVPGVVAQLDRLQSLLERSTPGDLENPVADFNRLYWTITSRILDRLRRGAFADSEFLTLLDVEFAKRYLDALRRWGKPAGDTPQAWKVLFCRLRDTEVRSLPSAAAGVNAHINYDLPFALISTWDKLGSGPDNERQHRDYLLVNEVFFEEIPQLRRSYLSNWQLCIDRLNGPIDDWYQNHLVEFTRDVAWRDAERLWPERHDPERVEWTRTRLDLHTAFIGWALLSPVGALLQ
nr:DUF5995 family protein [Micromonospora sp. DSM 115978]